MQGNYSIEADAQTIRDATDIVGTNMAKLTDILCCRPAAHIKALRDHFEKDNLMHRIKVETSGKVQFALEAILRDDAGRRRAFIEDAVDGAGTNETLLIDCILAASQEQIRELQKSWGRNHKLPLIARLNMDGVLLGGFHSLIEQAIADNKPASGVMENKIAEDIEALYKATEGKIGTDEAAITKICNSRSREHLIRLNEEYKKKSKKGKPFLDTIRSETSGNLQDALICSFVKPSEWLAMRIHLAMKGVGTNEKQLMTCIFLASDQQLKEINVLMQERYKEDLVKRVKAELSGDLEKVMVKYVEFHLK